MRLVTMLVLAGGMTLAWILAPPAEAGDVRLDLDRLNRPNHWAPPPPKTPSTLRGGDPKIYNDGGRRHFPRGHHPRGVVIVAPQRCWQPGYWTHQWVPRSYTYNTWVAGHWSPDGRWVEGHYTPYVHHAGYYQPYWVEGYWTAC